MTAPGWPVSLTDGRVEVRPLRLRDANRWSELRLRNEAWLAPWDGRPPGEPEVGWEVRNSAAHYTAMLRLLRREAKEGRTLPFGVAYDGDLVGQVTVASIVRGAFQSASIGYWVDQQVAGRQVMPTAVALVVDHCFAALGLHRIEASVRPENAPSLRLVRKLGFREEGSHPRLLHIDGAWRDHLSFALTTEDVPEGLLARWHSLAPQQLRP